MLPDYDEGSECRASSQRRYGQRINDHKKGQIERYGGKPS